MLMWGTPLFMLQKTRHTLSFRLLMYPKSLTSVKLASRDPRDGRGITLLEFLRPQKHSLMMVKPAIELHN